MTRRLIYTAILGDYDVPPYIFPSAVDQGCDYICFADSELDLPRPWTLYRIEQLSLGAAATNRWVKFCVHSIISGYDHAVYMDGNIDLSTSPSIAFDRLGDGVSCVFVAHPKRRSVRDELEACVLARKMTFSSALRLIAMRSRSGFDDRLRLTANRFFARRLSDSRSNAMFEAVFEDYLREPRDQLHLQFALQRFSVPHVVLPPEWALEAFTVRPHKGIDSRRGRLGRVVRRLALGIPLRLLLKLVAYVNRREEPAHD